MSSSSAAPAPLSRRKWDWTDLHKRAQSESFKGNSIGRLDTRVNCRSSLRDVLTIMELVQDRHSRLSQPQGRGGHHHVPLIEG